MQDLYTTENIMFFFFICLLIISIWKIYAFLPNKQLADDDTTREATEALLELLHVSVESLCKKHQPITTELLFEAIQKDPNFDKQKYWRFNQNRLNQLLTHYLREKNVKQLSDVCH